MRPIGVMIDELHKLREEKRAVEADLNGIKAQLREAEMALIEQMDREGMDKASSSKMTISVGESMQFSIDDWDETKAFILKEGLVDILQKRPSALVCRELYETGRQVPGLVPRTVRKLHMRNL